ncbi:MAG: aspartate/glutamate racemase family protein [Rubrivivax sp.]|nr:aspartate/glutamate racemase family protein [Rubrivivax sp.]
MRTLGVIGGMSWESTAVYYRLLNEGVARRLGGLHSAALRLHSVDFAAVAAAQADGRWDTLAELMCDAARGLVAAGAQGLLVATNTMHRLAPQLEAAVDVPLLHIADATARAVRAAGASRVGLLGTRFTMEDGAVLLHRLRTLHGLTVDVPPPAARAEVHRVIYDELCRGRIEPASRAATAGFIAGLAAEGARGVILGCTELGLLIDAVDSPLPVFDSTALHAAAAVDWMLEGHA